MKTIEYKLKDELRRLIIIFHFALSFCILIFIFYIFAPTAQALTIGKPANFLALNTGLVGHWTFDGPKMISNVADSSGQGNNGYMSGFTSTSSAVVAGKIGQGLSFDGSNDYVDMGNPSVLNVVSAGTVATWAKYGNQVSSSYPGVVCKGDPNTDTNGYCLLLWLNVDAGICIEIMSGETEQIKCTKIGWKDNKWHHIVATWDGSFINLYADGVLQGSPLTQTVTPTPETVNFRLGRDNSGSTRYTGSLDDVRVYNRALSAQEIQQLYNMGAASKISSTPRGLPDQGLNSGLVGHWTFDGPKMTTNVADSSGVGNTGYLIHGGSGTTTVPGKMGQALAFDGSDSYATISSTSAPGTDITVSAWVKASNTSSGTIVYRGTTAYGVSYRFDISSGKLRFALSTGPGASPDITVTSSGSIQPSIWTLVSATYSSSAGKIYLYVNGSVDPNSGNRTGAINNQVSTTNIGALNPAAAYFSGYIDDVRIYNRALSENEIKQLYNIGAGSKQAATPKGIPGQGLNSGLVGHWTFDGKDMISNVKDTSGVSPANTGYLVGFTSTTTVAGKLGQGLSFDGINDYISITQSASLQFGTGSFSVSAWIHSASTTQSSSHIVANRWGTPYWDFVSSPNSSAIQFSIQDASNNNAYVRTPNGTAPNYKWHHVVGVVDRSTQQMSVYVDGTKYTNESPDTSSVGSVNNGTNLVMIGQSQNVASGFFQGNIDDVHMYNRALSATEIFQLYNLGH